MKTATRWETMGVADVLNDVCELTLSAPLSNAKKDGR